MAIDLEQAVEQFLEAARARQAAQIPTAELVLEWLIDSYRDVRIAKADIDSDGDMLEGQVAKFRSVPFVRELLGLRPLRMIGVVQPCG